MRVEIRRLKAPPPTALEHFQVRWQRPPAPRFQKPRRAGDGTNQSCAKLQAQLTRGLQLGRPDQTQPAAAGTRDRGGDATDIRLSPTVEAESRRLPSEASFYRHRL